MRLDLKSDKPLLSATEQTCRIPLATMLLPLFSCYAATVLTLLSYGPLGDGLPLEQRLTSAGRVAALVFAVAIAVDIIGLLLTAARPGADESASNESALRVPSRIPVAVTSLAASLAGSSRPHLRSEWLAHLAGAPEDGSILSPQQKRRLARGFLVAAVSLRLGDAVRPLWRPVDWVLSSDSRLNATVTAGIGSLVVYVATTSPFDVHIFLADLVAVFLLGGGAYTLANWLRKVRGIELSDLKKPDSE